MTRSRCGPVSRRAPSHHPNTCHRGSSAHRGSRQNSRSRCSRTGYGWGGSAIGIDTARAESKPPTVLARALALERLDVFDAAAAQLRVFGVLADIIAMMP